MRQRLERRAFVSLCALALTLGIFQSQPLVQQPSPVQVADPGGNGSGGG